jgi:hypothetical protein
VIDRGMRTHFSTVRFEEAAVQMHIEAQVVVNASVLGTQGDVAPEEFEQLSTNGGRGKQ